jgi:putative glycosyltransferase (TIGR04372 family)
MLTVRRKARATIRKLYDSTVLGCGVLLALPLRLLSPLYRIEVQPLLVERIGHLAIEPELLLSLRDVHPPRRTTTLFFCRGRVANSFLVSMWRRALHVGPGWLLHPMWVANQRFPWLDLGARGWDELHFDLRHLDETKPHLHFTPEDHARGRALLRGLGLDPDEPFACLAVRDGAYLTTVAPERDWTYHDYRDSDIATYRGLAETLADSGFPVLRMGAVVASPLASAHPKVIDYATSGLRSDFGDVYLFAHCRMSISSSTGVDSLAMAFRRPMGIVNLPGTGGLQLSPFLRLVMFKDLLDSSTGEPITLFDPRRPAAMAAYRTDSFAALGLRLEDNSSDLLTAFGREMLLVESGASCSSEAECEVERELLRFIDPGRDLSDVSFQVARCWLVRTEMRPPGGRLAH